MRIVNPASITRLASRLADKQRQSHQNRVPKCHFEYTDYQLSEEGLLKLFNGQSRHANRVELMRLSPGCQSCMIREQKRRSRKQEKKKQERKKKYGLLSERIGI